MEDGSGDLPVVRQDVRATPVRHGNYIACADVVASVVVGVAVVVGQVIRIDLAVAAAIEKPFTPKASKPPLDISSSACP